MEKTVKEFEQEVLSYIGQYPLSELKKFINYWVLIKDFRTFKTFDVKRRLSTWFSPKRKEKFKEKNKGNYG